MPSSSTPRNRRLWDVLAALLLVYCCAEARAVDSACPPASAASTSRRPQSPAGQPIQVHEVSVHCGTVTAVQNVEPKSSDSTSQKDGTSNVAIQIVELLVKTLTGLAWPALVLAFLLLFREQIGELIRRIKGAQWGDAGLLFADRVEAAEAKANIDPTPEADAAIQPPPVTVASHDPRGVILSAWLQVEQALYNLVEVRGIAESYNRPSKRPLTSIRLVQQAGFLDERYVALFHELRMLRNDAAHVQDFSPPLDSVVRYTQLAGELVAELRRRASTIANG